MKKNVDFLLVGSILVILINVIMFLIDFAIYNLYKGLDILPCSIILAIGIYLRHHCHRNPVSVALYTMIISIGMLGLTVAFIVMEVKFYILHPNLLVITVLALCVLVILDIYIFEDHERLRHKFHLHERSQKIRKR